MYTCERGMCLAETQKRREREREREVEGIKKTAEPTKDMMKNMSNACCKKKRE